MEGEKVFSFLDYHENNNTNSQSSGKMSLLEKETPSTTSPSIGSDEVLLFNKFQIRGEKFGTYIDRYCLLTPSFLYIYEDQNKSNYLGKMKLEFMSTHQSIDDSSANKRYVIKYQKN